MHMILASKSPRRKELLSARYSDFEVVVSSADETLDEGIAPKRAVEILAIRKGEAVAHGCSEDSLVISSDTLVELDGEALGKPRDRDEAYKMLRSLSGRAHNVHTGVAVHYKGERYSGVATSAVTFRALSDEEIYAYIDSGAPYDKAGGYGIQGEAGKFVSHYEGDFDTIVGLSMALTEELIEKARRLPSDKIK